MNVFFHTAIQTSHITTCCIEMEQARSTSDVTHPSAILLEVSGLFICHLPERTQQNNQKSCQLCKPHGVQQPKNGQDPTPELTRLTVWNIGQSLDMHSLS